MPRTPGVAQHLVDAVDEVGVHRVHQAPVDVAGGVLEHHEDRDRDDQTDDRVGGVPSESDSAGADEHGERGEAVGTGMQPVRDQRCRADVAPHPDPVARDQLVPGEAHQAGDGDRPQVARVAAGDQPTHRRVGRHQGRDADDEDDRDARQVLGATEAVGVAAGRRTPAEPEGDRERDRGQRVATLWRVSESSAAEPVNTKTSACTSAVSPSPTSDTHRARIPRAEASSSESTAMAG